MQCFDLSSGMSPWDTHLIPITAFQMDIVELKDGEETGRGRVKNTKLVYWWQLKKLVSIVLTKNSNLVSQENVGEGWFNCLSWVWEPKGNLMKDNVGSSNLTR